MIQVNNRRRAISIILICNAILLSYLDTFIPMPIPGVKLGLANIITVIAIVFLSYKDVIFIVVFRCVVVAILTKGIIALAFSLSAGILSASIMYYLYKKAIIIFSIKGISVIGALAHNVIQILVASIIINDNIVLYYLPFLLIASVITGLIIGYISEAAIKEVLKRGLLCRLKI